MAGNMPDVKNVKLRKFLLLSILGILVVDIPFISSLIVMANYGTLTLYPGEKYTLNIPFIGPSAPQPIFPEICGKAQFTNGTLVDNITVIATYKESSITLAQNITGKNGKFCLILPEINKTSEEFNISLKYDDSILTLGSNDYSLHPDNYRVYNKSTDSFVILSGNITNQDAQIENGRFEINLEYNETGKFSHSEKIFDYKKYKVNISSGDIYDISNLDITWPIDSETKVGAYKFYIKTSFNAKERTKDVYFNITN